MEIAKLGDRTNATTFFKFYEKEIQVSSSESAAQPHGFHFEFIIAVSFWRTIIREIKFS